MIQCVFKRVEMKCMLNREQYERLQLVMSQYMVGDGMGHRAKHMFDEHMPHPPSDRDFVR